jgi:hypothetical protein
MGKKMIVGPNPLQTARMTADERLNELSTILAAGAVRLRLKQEAQANQLADNSQLDPFVLGKVQSTDQGCFKARSHKRPNPGYLATRTQRPARRPTRRRDAVK